MAAPSFARTSGLASEALMLAVILFAGRWLFPSGFHSGGNPVAIFRVGD
jgi:hypothetical protein